MSFVLQDNKRNHPRGRARNGFLRSGIPNGLDWALLSYALLAVAAGVAYTALKIESDYRQTLTLERNVVRGATASLQTGTLAMLDDGVGAALAGAGEVRATGGLDRVPDARLRAQLRRQLTGGTFVRGIFIADQGRFVLVTRQHTLDLRTDPRWLAAATGATTWVGAPMREPGDPNAIVVPVARRTLTGPGTSGWAGALFDFTSLPKLYPQFGSPISELGLIASNGTVLVAAKGRHLDHYRGVSLAHNELWLRARATGTDTIVQGLGSAGNKEKIYGQAPVVGYPISVYAGQSLGAVLKDWRLRRRNDIEAATAFGALVLTLTAFLGHSMRALRMRERDYRTLFNNAKVAVFILEGDRIIEANRTVATMFGLGSEREAIGLTPWDLSPPVQPNGRPSRELARERLRTTALEGSSTFEWTHKRLDSGEPFPAEVDLSCLGASGTALALAVVHDLTERKRAEEELRVLSSELMHHEHEERRRVGRDLHDSTGQSLAALEIALSQLGRETDRLTPNGREQLRYCVRLAGQCSSEIRTASYLLHPPLLDELGLVSALEWLADGLRERSGIEVRLELPRAFERLAPEEELALFRVAQEALTNVHRHSESPWVLIRLSAQPQYIVLEIEDAGRGISRDVPGVGVAGMRERIRQFGGTLLVESPAGGGTLIRASLPRPRPIVEPIDPKVVAGA